MTPTLVARDESDESTFEVPAAPTVARGFREVGEYLLLDPSGEVSELVVDDEPLQRVENAPGAPIAWRWAPGFYAGEVSAEARSNGRTFARFRLDVSPDPRKAGREVFAQLLDELWSADPSLVLGDEPATTRVGRLDPAQNPWLEFERIRRYGPVFVTALSDVVRRPRARLVAEREDRPAHRVRRVDRTTARSALRNPATLALMRPDLLDDRGGEPRFDVPRVTESLDSAANRALAALIDACLSRVRALLTALEEQSLRDEGEPGARTRTPLAARWPERRRLLEAIAHDLRCMRQRSPFSMVSRPEVTAAGLVAVDADPAYARSWGSGWRALRRGAGGERNAERQWLGPTWQLYERWCFVRLERELRDQNPDLDWRAVTPKSLGLLADAARVGEGGGRRMTLLLQPAFHSHPAGRDAGPYSISLRRFPDLVLLEHRSDRLVRFDVLDAKYRTARSSLMEGMSSAHIYRDSLRFDGRRPDLALLLAPDVSTAEVLASPEYQAANGCGAQSYLPGVGAPPE